MRAGSGRHRLWPDALKQRVVTETLEPGVRVIDVARWHGVPDSLVSNWRTAVRRGKLTGAPPVEAAIADEAAITFAPMVVGAPTPAMMTADGEQPGPQIIVANVVDRLEAGASAERICAIVRGLCA